MDNSPVNNEKPDSFLGYYVEAPRALYHIMSDDSISRVRIENLDDVSVFDYEEKIKKLEQIKYKSPCNFTNYSPDLWNTLYNWFCVIENINSNKLCSNIKFVIYSWDKCNIGSLANDFLNIKDKDNFSEVWNKQIEYFKDKDDNNEIKHYFTKLNTNQSLTEFILKAFYIKQPNKTSTEDFVDMLEEKYSEAFSPISEFHKYIKGCFYIDLENPELKNNRIIEINRANFNFYRDRYGRILKYSLIDYSTIQTSQVENLKESLFAKQLEVINLNKTVDLAIKDVITWQTLCSECLANGYINTPQINQLYTEAKNEWTEHREILKTEKEDYKGSDLYERCCNERFTPNLITIEGSQKRVSRGIYNELANKPVSHKYSVGWHYEYENKFKDFYERDIQ